MAIKRNHKWNETNISIKTESTTNFLLYYLEKEKILLVKIIKLEKV